MELTLKCQYQQGVKVTAKTKLPPYEAQSLWT
jgi:hypothetical protein